MAIILNPAYPAPNRSRQSVQLAKSDDGVVDLGWCEGVLSDGRPFRAELWAQDDTAMLTVFFSSEGIADFTPEDLEALVEADGLVLFREGQRRVCDVCAYVDDGGARLWSVNIVVGDEAATYLDDTPPIWRHHARGAPATLFNAAAALPRALRA